MHMRTLSFVLAFCALATCADHIVTDAEPDTVTDGGVEDTPDTAPSCSIGGEWLGQGTPCPGGTCVNPTGHAATCEPCGRSGMPCCDGPGVVEPFCSPVGTDVWTCPAEGVCP